MSVERRLTEQFMMRCDAPGCNEYFYATGPFDGRGANEDKAFRLGWTKEKPQRLPTVMTDDYCPTCTKKRRDDAER